MDSALVRQVVVEQSVSSLSLGSEEPKKKQGDTPALDDDDYDDVQDFESEELRDAPSTEVTGSIVSTISVLRDYLFKAHPKKNGKPLMEWDYEVAPGRRSRKGNYDQFKALLHIPAWNQTFYSDFYRSKKEAQAAAVEFAMASVAKTKRHAGSALREVMEMMMKRPVMKDDLETTFMELRDDEGFNCRVRLFPQFHEGLMSGGLPRTAFEANAVSKSAAAHAASLQALVYLTTELSLPPHRDNLVRLLADDYKSWDSGIKTLRFENMAPETDWDTFQRRFQEFGNVTDFTVKGTRHETGTPRRSGSVTFDSTLAAHAAARQLDGLVVDGHMVHVHRWGGTEKDAYSKRKPIIVRGHAPATKKGNEVKLFYSNALPTVSPSDMLKLFEEVSSACSLWYWVDQTTGKSRGKGVVTFPSQEAADSAAEHLKGKQLGKRKLQVNPYSKHKDIMLKGHAPTPPSGEEVKIFYTNAPPTASASEMLQTFEEVSPVCSVWYWVHQTTGKSRGRGVVTLPSQEAADRVLEQLDNTELSNKRLLLKPYVPPQDEATQDAA